MELLHTLDSNKTLIQCVSCKMYRQITEEEHQSFLQTFEVSQKEGIVINCFICRENESLMLQIGDLNKTVEKLNERVTSLLQIRDGEESLDRTIEDITSQLAVFHINGNNSSTIVDDISSSEVPLPDGKSIIIQANISETTNNTSIWDDSVGDTHRREGPHLLENKSVMTDKLTNVNISIQTEGKSFTSISSTTNTQTDSLMCATSATQTEKLNNTNIRLQTESKGSTSNSSTINTQTEWPMHVSSATQTLRKTLTTCNNRDPPPEIIDIPENICQSAINLRTCDNWINDIEILIVGDGSFKHLKPLSDSKKTFKIARAGAPLSDLIDTAEFFLTAFPNLQVVLFHGGINNMKDCKTEVMKHQYLKLITAAKLLGLKLILSGPCPYLLMRLDAFSRTNALNAWLLNNCHIR